jgi:hypothetical protein
MQKATFQYKDMESSMGRNSRGYGETFLSDTSENRDVENAIEKTVVISRDSN